MPENGSRRWTLARSRGQRVGDGVAWSKGGSDRGQRLTSVALACVFHDNHEHSVSEFAGEPDTTRAVTPARARTWLHRQNLQDARLPHSAQSHCRVRPQTQRPEVRRVFRRQAGLAHPGHLANAETGQWYGRLGSWSHGSALFKLDVRVGKHIVVHAEAVRLVSIT